MWNNFEEKKYNSLSDVSTKPIDLKSVKKKVDDDILTQL
jgi:hypothetical protein